MENKKYKSVNIELFGIKYQAYHKSLSSLDNKYLLLLAEIKYFITYYCKKIYKLTLQSTINYLINNYEKEIIEISAIIIIPSVVFGLFYIGLLSLVDCINKSNCCSLFEVGQVILNNFGIVLYWILRIYFWLIRIVLSFLIISKTLWYIYKSIIEFINKIPTIEKIDG